MSTSYFSKELPDSPIYINGQPYRFDFLATSDESLIRHLTNAAARRVGGVLVLTKQQYDEAVESKKKQKSQPSSQRRPGREEIRQKVIPSPRSRDAARVAAAEGDGVFATPEAAAVATKSLEQYKPTTAKGLLR